MNIFLWITASLYQCVATSIRLSRMRFVVIICFKYINSVCVGCQPNGLQLSKPIASEEGKELGLVDEIVAPEDLLTIARRWALDIALGKRPRLSSLQRTDKLESLGDAREIIKFARAQVKKTAPNLTHPLLCLDAVEEGVVAGGYRGALKVLVFFFIA